MKPKPHKVGPGWEWPNKKEKDHIPDDNRYKLIRGDGQFDKERGWQYNAETGKYDIPPAHPNEKPLDPDMLWEASW